jgi:hypothetical protein
MASIVIDTKLMLLLVVGSASRAMIARHKRVAYGEADFDLLLRILSGFREIVLTPGILAETSG